MRQSPAWFGSVMATAALSSAFLEVSDFIGGSLFTGIADALLVLATILVMGLTPLYVLRALHRRDLAQEIADPVRGPMLATFPAGILVYAAAWATVGAQWLGTGIALTVCAILLVIGATLGLSLSIAWASLQSGEQIDLAEVNGSWLIPPAMNLVVPLSVAPLMTAYPDQAAWLLGIGLAFYGMGLLLYIPMFSLVVARLALRPAPPAETMPSLWVPLAPAGLMGLSLLRLSQAGATTGILSDGAIALGVVVCAMGIGLGLWWAMYAFGRLLRARRAGGVPFTPGWWGFAFPIGALVLALAGLADEMASVPIQVAAFLGFVCLVAVWTVVALRSSTEALRRWRS